MYEISCEMCRDLIPLVEDGVASEDSRVSVFHHIKHCPNCHELYTGEQISPADEKKAVSRFVGRLQLTGLLLLAAGGLAGILATEQIIQGSSAVFLVLAFCIGWLFRFAWTRKSRRGRILTLLMSTALAVGLCLLLNALIGNPVSRILARQGAEDHIAAHYDGTDYQVERVTYNFTMGRYYAVITSPSRVDGQFELDFDMTGNVIHDWYDELVASGKNTGDRLYGEYRDLVDPIIKRLNLETSVHIGFGQLEMDEAGLMVDGEYDVAALGAEYGHLIVTVRDEDATAERAAELLMKLEALMTEHGGTYSTIDFSIWSTESAAALELENFSRIEICEEDLADRIRAAAEITHP